MSGLLFPRFMDFSGTVIFYNQRYDYDGFFKTQTCFLIFKEFH